MNRPPANQNDPQENLELRIRTMRTLWAGMLLSVGAYYFFTFFAGRSHEVGPNSRLSLILLGVGLLTTLISFPIKNKLLTRAVEQRQVQQVQQGYIVAWAITEVAAGLGLLDFFLTSDPYFYILFLIAALADLFHFPRREHLVNAGFKGSIF